MKHQEVRKLLPGDAVLYGSLNRDGNLIATKDNGKVTQVSANHFSIVWRIGGLIVAPYMDDDSPWRELHRAKEKL